MRLAAFAAAAILSAMTGAASANTITVRTGDLASASAGTITCSVGCQAFTLAGGAGAGPTGVGTLSSTDAFRYDGSPASNAATQSRLTTLLGAAAPAVTGSASVSGSPLSFTLNAATALYVALKLGPTDVYLKLLGGPQNIVYTGAAGVGGGVSGWVAFGTAPQVPLPAAAWMMIAGLGGLAAARRRAKA